MRAKQGSRIYECRKTSFIGGAGIQRKSRASNPITLHGFSPSFPLPFFCSMSAYLSIHLSLSPPISFSFFRSLTRYACIHGYTQCGHKPEIIRRALQILSHIVPLAWHRPPRKTSGRGGRVSQFRTALKTPRASKIIYAIPLRLAGSLIAVIPL